MKRRGNVSNKCPSTSSGACERLGLIGRAKINNGKTTVSPGPSARFGRDNLRGPIMRTHVSFIPDAPYLHPDCITNYPPTYSIHPIILHAPIRILQDQLRHH